MKTIEERADIYEEISGCYGCQLGQVKEAFIAGAKSEHEELTRWNSPKCPPEEDKAVIVKYLDSGFELYSIGDYDKKYGWSAQDEVGFNKDNIIGWMEIPK